MFEPLIFSIKKKKRKKKRKKKNLWSSNKIIKIHKFNNELKEIGENTILIPTFWGYSQFGPYILIAVNLVSTF